MGLFDGCPSAFACGKLPWEEPDNFPDIYHDSDTPEQIQPERAVTIGIGFKCHDGIVIATDTQYSRGGFKTHGPKLFDFFAPAQLPNLSVLAAGAGRVSYMKMAIAKLEEALRHIPDPSLSEVKDSVEKSLQQVFQSHIYPMPTEAQNSAAFELLLGVWTRKDGYALLQTDGTAVTQEMVHGSGYCLIGSGIPLSAYALDLSWSPGMLTVETAKFLATFSIKAAKDYVNSCGGKTKTYILKQDADGYRGHRVYDAEVVDLESYSEDVFSLLKSILVCLDPDYGFDKESIGMLTDMLRDSIIAARDKQKDRHEKMLKAREKNRRQAAEIAERIRKEHAT